MTKDIYEAALRGDTKTLAAILASGGNSNEKNEVGYTPLMAAAHDGRTECIKILLEHSAEVNSEDESGFTALTNAVQHSNIITTKLLIENGANANHETKAKFTPLMFVAYNNYPPTDKIELANILLEAGADPAVTDSSDLTASDHAARKGLDGLSELLKTNI